MQPPTSYEPTQKNKTDNRISKRYYANKRRVLM
jgi:hypothetical protein